MAPDDRFVSERFPRSSKYHPDWVIASASGGANSLWLVEWPERGAGRLPPADVEFRFSITGRGHRIERIETFKPTK